MYARADGVASGTPREGLDLRGEGGMVVAPPSVHPSGRAYAFAGSCRALVPLDAISSELVTPAGTVSGPRLHDAEAWVALQAPKLQEAWRRLKEPASYSFDASRADFAIARCFWEAGWPAADVVALLLSLPGSRAAERGESYAAMTIARAFSARYAR